jgi:esterase/lipase
VVNFQTRSKGEEFFADPKAESQLWSYDEYPVAAGDEIMNKLGAEVIQNLPRVSCPLLIFYSTKDPMVGKKGIQLLYDQVSSTDKDLVILHESGHVVTVDSEWEVVAEKSYQRLPPPVLSLLRRPGVVRRRLGGSAHGRQERRAK